MIATPTKMYSFRKAQIIAASIGALAAVSGVLFLFCKDEPVLFPALNCAILNSESEIIGVAKKFIWKKKSKYLLYTNRVVRIFGT